MDLADACAFSVSPANKLLYYFPGSNFITCLMLLEYALISYISASPF